MTQSALAAIIESPITPQGPALTLRHGRTLNGASLAHFFSDQDKSSGRRIDTLLDQLMGVSIEERNRAVSEYTALNKVLGPKGKEVIDPVASTRASEVKILWAGLNILGEDKSKLVGMGYHRIVQDFRRMLHEHNVNPDGEARQSAEEKAKEKRTKVQANAMGEALLANPRKDGEDTAAHMTRVAKIVETAGLLASAVNAKEIAEKLAKSLTEKHPWDVIHALHLVLGAWLQHPVGPQSVDLQRPSKHTKQKAKSSTASSTPVPETATIQ